MSNLAVFEFEDQSVRVIMLEGEPWFVVKDVAAILGYEDPSKMVNLVHEDDKQTINPQKIDPAKMAETFGSNTFRLSLVNESGLYDCVFGSTKQQAKTFKRWVTSKVLPSIRKTGSYSVNPQPPAIASWYSRVMLFHQKNNIPIGYWSIFEMTINLVAKLEEYGYALPEGKILDISIGKCWAAYMRNQLKINPDNVAQKYKHYYPGWAHPIEANIYPVSLLIPFQEWLQSIYKPIKLPAYFKGADPTALPAVEKMLRALPGT